VSAIHPPRFDGYDSKSNGMARRREEHVSRLHIPYLHIMPFPALFPFGKGDATCKDRNVKVCVTYQFESAYF
jgi:hypothetical protein